MLFHLVKKDFVLIKKFVFITMLMLAALPAITVWIAPSVPGFYTFLYMVIIGEIMLLQALSQTEAKSPKAAALLCAAPYSRSTIVEAKYVLFLLLFAYCYVAYTFVILAANLGNLLDLSAILMCLLFSAIICGIYLPIEFKYGLVKTKFIFMIMVLAFSLGPNILSKVFPNISIDLSAIKSLPSEIKYIGLALANVVVFSISMLISLRIYNKKDL